MHVGSTSNDEDTYDEENEGLSSPQIENPCVSDSVHDFTSIQFIPVHEIFMYYTCLRIIFVLSNSSSCFIFVCDAQTWLSTRECGSHPPTLSTSFPPTLQYWAGPMGKNFQLECPEPKVDEETKKKKMYFKSGKFILIQCQETLNNYSVIL